jgi:hypothetical protein
MVAPKGVGAHEAWTRKVFNRRERGASRALRLAAALTAQAHALLGVPLGSLVSVGDDLATSLVELSEKMRLSAYWGSPLR